MNSTSVLLALKDTKWQFSTRQTAVASRDVGTLKGNSKAFLSYHEVS